VPGHLVVVYDFGQGLNSPQGMRGRAKGMSMFGAISDSVSKASALSRFAAIAVGSLLAVVLVIKKG
jgi:hypothetical protein